MVAYSNLDHKKNQVQVYVGHKFVIETSRIIEKKIMKYT